MQINISSQVGFCTGVKRAIQLATTTLSKYKDNVYCIGDFIHNDRVVADLSDRGLKVVERIAEIPDKAVVLIRAHGESKENLQELKEKDCLIVDATCPSVTSIKNKLIEYEKEGYFIVVFGQKNHPEIISLTSNLKNYYITENINDYSFFDLASSFYIVFQTTFSTLMHKEHIANLYKKGGTLGKLVDIFDSICYTTLARRESCFKIAKKSDIILVLGDKKSNNSRELYKMTKALSKETYFLTTIDDFANLNPQLNNAKTIGLIAGASTPYELIEEVLDLMELINQENGKSLEINVENDTLEENNLDGSQEEPIKQESMEEIFEKIPDKSAPPLKEGQVIEVEVVGIDNTKDELHVSFDTQNRKNDHGFIASSELDIEGKLVIDDFKAGDRFPAMILDYKKTQSIEFSKKAYEKLHKEEEKALELIAGKDIAFVCTEINVKERNNRFIEQGLVFKAGRYKIFAPKSQIVIPRGKRLADLKGKEVLLRILPQNPDPEKKYSIYNILAGQRAIFDEKDNEFWDNYAIPGNIVKGTVIRYGEKDSHIFGAFVSVNDHDCLAHISEFSWDKNIDPKEVLKIGKEYEFQVLEVDRERNKVSLSYKRLFKSPIDSFLEKNPIGSIVSGEVAKILPFGAFITLTPEIDGMVHISQISYERIEKIEDVLTIGQVVDAKVIKYEDQRISLSLKELAPQITRNLDNEASSNKKFAKFDNKKNADIPYKADDENNTPGTRPKKKRASKEGSKERNIVIEQNMNGSSGATFGDTEEAKKLMKLVTEEDS